MMKLLIAFLAIGLMFRPDVFAQKSILTIGDSNGAGQNGWPEHLKKILPGYVIVNRSVSGNTIGFDNLGRENLNTLRNIKLYLDQAYGELPAGSEFSCILVCLGTNDTKRIFIDSQKQVPENLSKLIVMIKDYMTVTGRIVPRICIITPPPMDDMKADKEKYGGGNDRIRLNNNEFKKVARKNKVDFLDTYSILEKDLSSITIDGVHLKPEAQDIVARLVAEYVRP